MTKKHLDHEEANKRVLAAMEPPMAATGVNPLLEKLRQAGQRLVKPPTIQAS